MRTNNKKYKTNKNKQNLKLNFKEDQTIFKKKIKYQNIMNTITIIFQHNNQKE